MVPLAIGTQTGGSVIRPASFCGVTGFKPTFGAIPRTGILQQAPSLDTVGVFARRPEDAALLAGVLFGHDDRDRATSIAPSQRLFENATSDPPVKPVFAMVKPPGWDKADPQTHSAFAELVDALGENCFEVELPRPFDDAAELRERINFAEMARCFHRYSKSGADTLGSETREALQAGAKILAKDYLAALDWQDVLNAGLDPVFIHADAILTPAALGPAPGGLDSTGSPIFNGLWTLCGTPAVSIPLFTGENGLPMGAQLVGTRGNDARLLRTARWLFNWVGASGGS
jgi:aspartyl-tRNA(Asn)/glutamyl-tRNA(Gln) amidotransferase subunit A